MRWHFSSGSTLPARPPIQPETSAAGLNLLSAVLAVSACLFYVFVYTLWLKRTSTSNIVIGGVVVAPRASELIHPVSIAVAESLTADSLAHAFTVYPSMSGSVAEAARRLHHRPD